MKVYTIYIVGVDGTDYSMTSTVGSAVLQFLSQYDHEGAAIVLDTTVYTSEMFDPDTAQYFTETDNEKIYQQLEQSI